MSTLSGRSRHEWCGKNRSVYLQQHQNVIEHETQTCDMDCPYCWFLWNCFSEINVVQAMPFRTLVHTTLHVKNRLFPGYVCIEIIFRIGRKLYLVPGKLIRFWSCSGTPFESRICFFNYRVAPNTLFDNWQDCFTLLKRRFALSGCFLLDMCVMTCGMVWKFAMFLSTHWPLVTLYGDIKLSQHWLVQAN